MRMKLATIPTAATMRNAMEARVSTRGQGARVTTPRTETMAAATADDARVSRTRKRRTLHALRHVVAGDDGVGGRARGGRLRLLAEDAARQRVDARGGGRVGIGREERLLALHRLRHRIVGEDAAPVLHVEV